MERRERREPKGPRRRSTNMRRSYAIGFFAWLALVAGISVAAYTVRGPTCVPVGPVSDKIGHFFLIGALAFFLDGALERRALVRRPIALPLAPVLVLAVAGIEEYCQRFSPRRSSSLGDFAADLAGVVALTLLSRRLDARAARAAGC